jgi:thioredoxin 1
MPATAIQNEQDFVLRNESMLVVDCSTHWYSPCQVVSRLIDQLADEYTGRAKVIKIDLAHSTAIAKCFKLRHIPAVMCFQAGALIVALMRVKPDEDYHAALERLLED